jgi:GNAT superfamily N-acetyltransferase
VTEFVVADLSQDRQVLVDLTVEYMNWIVRVLQRDYGINPLAIMGSVMEYAEESVADIGSYQPPRGIWYLLRTDEVVEGMGALRRLRGKIGEIKWMFIRPQYRGQGLGRALLEQLLATAKKLGLSRIYLDTGPFMTQAYTLYRSVGFRQRKAYPESEVPPQIRHLWRYMEKKL